MRAVGRRREELSTGLPVLFGQQGRRRWIEHQRDREGVRAHDPHLDTRAAERVAGLEVFARNSPIWDKKDPAELQLRHDLARAKLVGFLDRSDSVARRYPFNDNGLPARYARAIATYRHADLRVAIAQIDALIQTEPNNPYFHELKGQALLEGGKAAEAIAPH